MYRACVLALATLTLVTAASCGAPAAEPTRQGCPEGARPPSTEQVAAEHAEGWSVEYRDGLKILRVSSPSLGMTADDGEAAREQLFVLHQCGTPEPELTGDLAGATPVTVPITSAAVGEPAMPAAFEVLAPELVTAYDERAVDTATSMPKVSERITSGKAEAMGHGAQLDLEQLVASSPDMLFTAGGDTAKLDQLSRAGIGVLSYTGFQESPLGAAEQIKLLSLFTNQEEQANDYASGTIRRYQALAARAAAQPTKPTVLVGSNDHGPTFTARQRDYFDAALLRDAGTTNVLDEPGKSMMQVPMEKVVAKASDVDFWFRMNFAAGQQTAEQLIQQTPAIGEVAALRNGRAYARLYPKEYSSWGLLHPDELLADVVSVVHPTVLPDHRPAYFSPIENRG